MSRVTLDDLKQAISGVADDTKLRRGKGGEVKTARHGFFGRAVRWLFGATRKDRIDNKKIMEGLLRGLREKYGDDVGTSAFLEARPEAYLSKSGDVMATVNKPLKARQVRAAIAAAKASPLRYAPGGDKFKLVASRAQMPDVELSREQEQYFKSRLMESVLLRANQGKPLSNTDIEKYASKLLKHTVKNVDDEAEDREQLYDDAKRAAIQTIDALSGHSNRSAPDLLLTLRRNCDKVVSDSMLQEGDIGAQDVEDAVQRVTDSVVSRYTPRQAKHLYDRIMSPSGTGRQLLLAMNLLQLQTSGKMASAVCGCGEICIPLTILIRSLAARAGIPKDEIDTTMALFDTVPEPPKDRSRPPKDGLQITREALEHTGVKNARKVRELFDVVLKVATERGEDVEKRMQDELEEIERRKNEEGEGGTSEESELRTSEES